MTVGLSKFGRISILFKPSHIENSMYGKYDSIDFPILRRICFQRRLRIDMFGFEDVLLILLNTKSSYENWWCNLLPLNHICFFELLLITSSNLTLINKEC